MLDILKSRDRLLYEKGYIDEQEYLTRRSDGRFSKMLVTSAVIAVSLYVVVVFQFAFLNIQAHTSVFPPVEVSTGYFAFWTVEIIMLATIKKSKVKNKHEKEVSDDILSGSEKGPVKS